MTKRKNLKKKLIRQAEKQAENAYLDGLIAECAIQKKLQDLILEEKRVTAAADLIYSEMKKRWDAEERRPAPIDPKLVYSTCPEADFNYTNVRLLS